MTDTTLKNPIVTAVQAIKSGNDVVPVSTTDPMPVTIISGGGGGSSAGIGETSDTAATDSTSSWSLVSLSKAIFKKLMDGLPLMNGGTIVSSSNPLPITYTAATLTSRSGTIAVGGTAQTLMAANASRKGWFIQNVSTGDLWVNRFGGTASAAQPNILVPSGALYETPAGGSGGNAISVFGATTGQAFTSSEW